MCGSWVRGSPSVSGSVYMGSAIASNSERHPARTLEESPILRGGEPKRVGDLTDREPEAFGIAFRGWCADTAYLLPWRVVDRVGLDPTS